MRPYREAIDAAFALVAAQGRPISIEDAAALMTRVVRAATDRDDVSVWLDEDLDPVICYAPEDVALSVDEADLIEGVMGPYEYLAKGHAEA